MEAPKQRVPDCTIFSKNHSWRIHVLRSHSPGLWLWSVSTFLFLDAGPYNCLLPPTAYFAPAIIQSLGHDTIRTQLLSVPPWACAFGLAMTIAIVSDHAKHRFAFTLIPQAIALTGFGILFNVHHNPNLQYAALFLAAAGTYSSMPVIVCWFATNRTAPASFHMTDFSHSRYSQRS